MEQTAFLEILTFIAGALFFVKIGSWINSLLRPQHPNVEKLRTYESGETPAGNAWKQFNARFYIMAIVFMLFEVEVILLCPWTTVWANSGLREASGNLWVSYTVVTAVLFIALLTLGLAYVWSQGLLVNIQPTSLPSFTSKVPRKLYDRVNNRYANSSNYRGNNKERK